MGIYSRSTDEDLQQQRAQLHAALIARLTQPTSAAHNGRSIAYQQRTDDIKREISAIDAELDRRAGVRTGGPIYMV